MVLRAGGMLRRAGAVSILVAGVFLFTIGMLPVQAAARHSKQAITAPTCEHQPNLNDPTNSTNKVLESYWFSIEHAGQTTTVCTLFGNVSSGDVVTAHFTLVSPAPPVSGSADIEITLLSNTASSSSSVQNLFDCSSFSPGADPDAASDPCLAATSQVLTVHVPDCAFQVDLIYGEPLATMTIGQYRTEHRWIDGQVGNRSSGCTTDRPRPRPLHPPGRCRRRPPAPRQSVVSRASPRRAPGLEVWLCRSPVSRSSSSGSLQSCVAHAAGQPPRHLSGSRQRSIGKITRCLEPEVIVPPDPISSRSRLATTGAPAPRPPSHRSRDPARGRWCRRR